MAETIQEIVEATNKLTSTQGSLESFNQAKREENSGSQRKNEEIRKIQGNRYGFFTGSVILEFKKIVTDWFDKSCCKRKAESPIFAPCKSNDG